ncbi:hypothetical protein ON010_g7509 [Phytophthora cinnamomi]|nr:hypothetical protein ON010_g7509 [Phytophthora cinnamomi]
MGPEPQHSTTQVESHSYFCRGHTSHTSSPVVVVMDMQAQVMMTPPTTPTGSVAQAPQWAPERCNAKRIDSSTTKAQQDTAQQIGTQIQNQWQCSSHLPERRMMVQRILQLSQSQTKPNVQAALENQGDAANAPLSGASTLGTYDGPRSSLGGCGGAMLKRDTLEVEAEEEEARPSFMSTHGTQLQLDEDAQQERPSADCFMRLASLEMGGNNMNTNSDDEDVVADPGTSSSRDAAVDAPSTAVDDRHPVARQKSLDKMWQVLLRQRRFFSSKSLSSGSSNDRS